MASSRCLRALCLVGLLSFFGQMTGGQNNGECFCSANFCTCCANNGLTCVRLLNNPANAKVRIELVLNNEIYPGRFIEGQRNNWICLKTDEGLSTSRVRCVHLYSESNLLPQEGCVEMLFPIPYKELVINLGCFKFSRILSKNADPLSNSGLCPRHGG